MESKQVETSDGAFDVAVGGPQSAHVVALLPGSDDPGIYDEVCARLHESGLRTVVIGAPGATPSEAAVLEVLDSLGLSWVNLVGNGDGAEVAWLLAARTFGRFVSLIVTDRGHPAIPDATGTVRAADCPPVEVPTTVIVGDQVYREAAELSGRRVYADFRVVSFEDPAGITAAGQQLATEIVLRTSTW
ncbi:alpha/beta hydrolase [Aldersonia sp. NBC_00410]|uniref:alpha/beta fold hydrolase n=1 Tax=Aldersonia sp. NBC_00410 TaxID=2975954 RepID=UPI002252B5CB|nr:alpha/beta hydrolase [Aldersonia sp. NBC_00410]MCX5046534.1 alpha/beta hydrolase [Aldersonia sp. NBC_00410]